MWGCLASLLLTNVITSGLVHVGRSVITLNLVAYERSCIMSDELREFVYLDSMSVNSLLASQQMAVPRTVREVSEDVEGEDTQGSIGGSLGFSGVGSISAQLKGGETEQSRRLAETERRINDQYRFSILYRTLTESDQLIDIDEMRADDETSVSLNRGDVIKATGECVTDPFYRLLGSISSFMRISEVEKIEEDTIENVNDLTDTEGNWVFDIYKDILHGERIGLRIDPVEYSYPVLMSVNTEDLWITPEREFMGGRHFTVVGRVSQMLTGQSKWDFVDLLQIMDNTFTSESIDRFREVFAEIGDSLDSDEEIQLNSNISREDYVVEEPAVQIKPVAIYW